MISLFFSMQMRDISSERASAPPFSMRAFASDRVSGIGVSPFLVDILGIFAGVDMLQSV
jgi:hypothetical protein